MITRFKITFCSERDPRYIWDASIPARTQDGAVKALTRLVNSSTEETPIKVLRIKQID